MLVTRSTSRFVLPFNKDVTAYVLLLDFAWWVSAWASNLVWRLFCSNGSILHTHWPIGDVPGSMSIARLSGISSKMHESNLAIRTKWGACLRCQRFCFSPFCRGVYIIDLVDSLPRAGGKSKFIKLGPLRSSSKHITVNDLLVHAISGLVGARFYIVQKIIVLYYHSIRFVWRRSPNRVLLLSGFRSSLRQ